MNMDYRNYELAAEKMSEILMREKHMSCKFFIMNKEYCQNLAFPELSRDNLGIPIRIGDWYVIVKCSNGYLYYINVSHDSVVTMCAEVFQFIQYK